MNPGITVVGSTNVDMIMQLPHLPALGETVTDGLFVQTFGGKGANQAVAAARAGGQVTFVTCLGDDPFSDQILANFTSDGIDCSAIRIAPKTPTGLAMVLFDDKGDNYLAIAPGANNALLPEHVEACRNTIAASGMVVMQMEIPLETTRRTLEIAFECGVPVMFNFAPVRTKDLPVTAAMTYLVVNENEASLLADMPVSTVQDAEVAADCLLKLGPRVVIVTLGAAGAWIAAPELRCYVPAFPVNPVDTTAAGDGFCGALAVAITEGKELADAVRFASAASALSVMTVGAQPSLPTRDRIDAFLASHPAA